MQDLAEPEQQKKISSEHQSVRLAIESLTLTQFRNYDHRALHCDPEQSVIITGQNGAGKTNLLEALSLLASGRGLRGAKLAQLQRQPVQQQSNWGVAITLQIGGQEIAFGTGQQPDKADKRIIRINGEPLKSQTQLAHHFSVLWQTPQMDGLFTQSSRERRLYYDRICAVFLPEHSSFVAKYDYLRRERARLLTLPRADATWLTSLETKMAESSMAIAANRLEVLHALQQALEKLHPAFPKAHLALRGVAEQGLLRGGTPAVEIEEQMVSALQTSQAEDAQSGRASHGAHKMELEVVFAPKAVEAAYCSTGEQKALMLSLLLAQAQAIKDRQQRLPLLLLDEVVSHLDEHRRAALFETITALGCQSWMTGTETSLFNNFASAHHITVSEGEIR